MVFSDQHEGAALSFALHSKDVLLHHRILKREKAMMRISEIKGKKRGEKRKRKKGVKYNDVFLGDSKHLANLSEHLGSEVLHGFQPRMRSEPSMIFIIT